MQKICIFFDPWPSRPFTGCGILFPCVELRQRRASANGTGRAAKTDSTRRENDREGGKDDEDR